MFVGHYGPALAVKALPKPPSLGAAFIAVQLVDFAWSGFILTGIEHGRVEPGFMALSDLRLDHMPFTHSLPAALVWSLAAALIYRLIDRRGGWAPALLIGACVFSHWLLDLLVHAPDLPIGFTEPRVGLGWWDAPLLGIGAEALVLFGGFVLYMRATAPNGVWGRALPWLFLLICVALYAIDKLGPTPPSLQAVAPQALAAYAPIAALGFALDRTRVQR